VAVGAGFGGCLAPVTAEGDGPEGTVTGNGSGGGTVGEDCDSLLADTKCSRCGLELRSMVLEDIDRGVLGTLIFFFAAALGLGESR
jgi:hypothetical protein